jgi:hypothetical protein
MTDERATGQVTGTPRVLLRLEGLTLLIGATTAYYFSGGGWQFYALLFLAPDLAFLGYLFGSRVGTIAYNVTHSTVLPAALLGVGLASSIPLVTLGACIWLAHVGFDRALGYGLKYSAGFSHTHLGLAGRLAAKSA